jgi:hypothetical protein
MVVVNLHEVFVVRKVLYGRPSWARMVQRDTLDSCQGMVVETSMEDSLANDQEVVLSSTSLEGIDQGQSNVEPFSSSWIGRDIEQKSR